MTPQETSAYLRLRCYEAGGGCLRWYTKGRSEIRRRHPLVRIPGANKQVVARRALYEAEKGPIREGYCLTPHCGDECCIEPAHQLQITNRQKSVMGQRVSAGSQTRGARVAATRMAMGLVRLTEAQVLEIRSSDEPGNVIARRLGVHDKTVSDVRLWKTWRNVGQRDPFAGLERKAA